jgi:hypothetical protein
MLQHAQNELAQRSYAMALSYAELLLRMQPQHAQARAIAEQASEMMRSSAIYGGFLRAADRSLAPVAAALYRELPTGSSFRAQAWEPFPQVRNEFTRSRLAIAEAASESGMCDEIRTQVDRLHWVADSEGDPALQQGQRLLGKCRSKEASATDAPASEPFATPSRKTIAAMAGADPHAPHKHRRDGINTKADGELKDFPDAKKGASGKAKPETPADDKQELPKGLRNPFGP